MPGAPIEGVQQVPLPDGARSTGQVRRWTNDRGFGFIAPDDGGEDLFCHFSNIVGGNALIQDGQVEFVKVYDDRKGKERAEQVTGSGVTTNEGGGGGGGYGGGMGGGGGGGGYGVCYDFQKGQCTRGPACRFAHDNGQGGFGGDMGGMGGGGGGGGGRGICFDFQKGQCTRGEACRFSHASNGGPPPPGAYGAPQPNFPQGGYGAPQPGYGAPQPGYGAPQPGGYGAPPGSW